jgi:hypothetical protein
VNVLYELALLVVGVALTGGAVVACAHIAWHVISLIEKDKP